MKKIIIVLSIVLLSFTIYAREEIVFWHNFQGHLEKALNSVIDDYNKSQDKYIVLTKYCGNYKELQKKLLGAKNFQGVLPDIFIGYSSWIEKIGEQNLYKANEILSQDTIKKINSTLLEDAKFNNILYGLPFNKSIMLMYVNTDILNKYHIDITKYRARDFYKMLSDITNATGKPAMAFNLSTWFFENYILNLGGDLKKINSPISYTALNTIIKAFYNKLMFIKSGYSFQNYWVNQEVPIIFSSIVSINFMKDKIKFHYKRYNFPPADNGITKSVISGANLYFARKPNNLKALKNFINWLYSHNNLEKWFANSNYLPIYGNFNEGHFLKNCELILEPHEKNWFDKRSKLSGLLKKSIIYKKLPDNFFDGLDE